MTGKRLAVVSAVVVVTFYFLLLPGFWSWMPPSATVEIPATWSFNQDMPIDLRVSAWHANYELSEVRFCILPDRSQFDRKTPPIYPIILHQSPRTRSWNRLTLNRFTFPRTYRLKLVVPLKTLAEEGKVGRGTIGGLINTRIDHVGSVHRHSGGLDFREIGSEAGCQQQFQVALK